jgi:hypothetical protein
MSHESNQPFSPQRYRVATIAMVRVYPTALGRRRSSLAKDGSFFRTESRATRRTRFVLTRSEID